MSEVFSIRFFLAGTAVMAAYVLAFFGLQRQLRFELVCAFLAGGVLGLGVELASWFEQRTSIPRHVLATSLVIVAILAHWIAPRIIPGL